MDTLLLPYEIYFAKLQSIDEIKLSQREIDVIACILQGRSAKKIAALLSISPKTVEVHVRNITQKIGCGSREGIIDFIERSQHYLTIKQYYSYLLIQNVFEDILKGFAQQIEETPGCFIAHGGEKKQLPLIQQLKAHLKILGVTDIKEHRDASLADEVRGQLCMSSQSYDALKKSDFISFADPNNYYLTFFEALERFFPKLNIGEVQKRFKQQCNSLLDPAEVHSSQQSQPTPQSPPNQGPTEKSNPNKFWKRLTMGTVGLALGVLAFYSFSTHQEDIPAETIRSDLMIPVPAKLLVRSHLLAEIEENLRQQSEIQSIAIIGIGGSGKTTLSRHYARSQEASVVWEINAETSGTLKSSFEHLAYALAKSEMENKRLQGFQTIKDPKIREDKILSFVKDKLRHQSKWMLIFDNVEKFSDIKKYYPTDPKAWGNGTVIVTTRDHHLQHNTQIQSSLLIGKLSPQEKLDLFTKIMGPNKTIGFKKDRFLKKLPPFPLDISIAANYIRATQIPYDEYLAKLSKGDSNFTTTQEELLKETTNYDKTRYHLITLSLENILKAHKDFAELLLLISLVDSQNIPRSLLNNNKSSAVVDNLIYNLKKYSLITNEAALSNVGATFSIHRSTQKILLAYLTEILDLKNKKLKLEAVSSNFVRYLDANINESNFKNSQILANHCERILTHKHLLSDASKAKIEENLGSIYFHTCNYEKAKLLLEHSLPFFEKTAKTPWEKLANTYLKLANVFKYLNNFDSSIAFYNKSLELIRKNSPQESLKVANVLSQTGELYGITADYEKAKAVFKKSLDIYGKHFAENHIAVAKTLSMLGVVYLRSGDYTKAKAAIEKCISIISKYYPDNKKEMALNLLYLGDIYYARGNYQKALTLYNKSLADFKEVADISVERFYHSWILGHIGTVYIKFGNYKKGEEFINRALKIHNDYISNINHNYKAWLLFHLGDIAIADGNYTKAKSLINKGLDIYQSVFGRNNVREKDGDLYLANLYVKVGLSEKAKQLLENVLNVYEKYYHEDYTNTGHALRIMGEAYLSEKDLKKAETYLLKALAFFDKSNHVDKYLVLERLSDLCNHKAAIAFEKAQNQICETFKNQSLQFLTLAQTNLQKHFPKDSPHVIRIQSKIEELNNSLLVYFFAKFV